MMQDILGKESDDRNASQKDRGPNAAKALAQIFYNRAGCSDSGRQSSGCKDEGAVLYCLLGFSGYKCRKEQRSDNVEMEHTPRIIQEQVPGKQITLAHIIANPDAIIYKKLGLNPAVDYTKAAIGILTMSPSETAIIAGDLAIKASGVDLGFVDRFSGTLIITGRVSEVEAALRAIADYCRDTLGFTVCPLTKT